MPYMCFLSYNQVVRGMIVVIQREFANLGKSKFPKYQICSKLIVWCLPSAGLDNNIQCFYSFLVSSLLSYSSFNSYSNIPSESIS